MFHISGIRTHQGEGVRDMSWCNGRVPEVEFGAQGAVPLPFSYQVTWSMSFPLVWDSLSCLWKEMVGLDIEGPVTSHKCRIRRWFLHRLASQVARMCGNPSRKPFLLWFSVLDVALELGIQQSNCTALQQPEIPDFCREEGLCKLFRSTATTGCDGFYTSCMSARQRLSG